MAYIDEAARRSEKLIAAIENDPTIPDSTKKCVHDYIDFMDARGLAQRSITKNLYCLSTFLKAVGKQDVLKLNKEEVTRAIATVERSAYSSKTKQNIKITVKSFYKHFLGNDEFYPEQIRWLKTTLPEYKRLLPEDILSESDILKMIDVSGNVRDKAIIALLFDSGIRVGELLSLKIKDVDTDSEPAHITVTGKTGMRQVPITFSAPYIAAYLNTIKTRKPGESLLKALGSWSNLNVAIDRAGIARMLERVAKRAGIEKKVNPHSFRHARATYYANKLTEQQLKVFFGWTSGSRMASTYVHLSGRDIDNAILQANGMKPIDNVNESKLKVSICPKCKYANGTEMTYCGRCGGALDISTAIKDMDKEERLRKYMVEEDEKTQATSKGKAKKGREPRSGK